jgi:hypothetical protein
MNESNPPGFSLRDLEPAEVQTGLSPDSLDRVDS